MLPESWCGRSRTWPGHSNDLFWIESLSRQRSHGWNGSRSRTPHCHFPLPEPGRERSPRNFPPVGQTESDASPESPRPNGRSHRCSEGFFSLPERGAPERKALCALVRDSSRRSGFAGRLSWRLVHGRWQARPSLLGHDRRCIAAASTWTPPGHHARNRDNWRMSDFRG